MAGTMSWLSKIGSIIGKILSAVAKDAKPIVDIAAPVAEALLPQFSVEIAAADNLVTNIAKQATLAEAVAAAAGQATGTGAQKLAVVLNNIGPSIDAWVASNFPGAKAISAASKSGLVNAVVAIMNEIEPPVIAVPPKA